MLPLDKDLINHQIVFFPDLLFTVRDSTKKTANIHFIL